jgi:prolyl-tRNA synthetase
MTAERAIEIGNIFKLGSRYSQTMGAMYLDAEGQSRPIVMGSYGIGSGRAAATIAEQSHDDKGLIWPVAVAPFHVSLLNLGTSEDAGTAEAAERLYQELADAGIEVLFDDRSDRAGVKFNDADLIGNPIRLSVSTRTLANGQAEMKARKESEATFVPLEDVVQAVRNKLDTLEASEQTYP